MKSKKLVVLIIFGIVIATVLAGQVGAAAGEVVEITFLHHEAPAHRVAAFQVVIDLFEKEYPDIKVTQEVVMWGDAWIKTLAAIGAGNPPDFQFSIPDLLLTVYRADAILSVTDIVKEIDEEYKFFKGQIETYFHDGEYWGVSIWSMVMLLTYRLAT